MAVHPLEDVAVRLGSADVQIFEFVGIPLEDVHGAMSEGEAKRLARTLEDEVAELIARG